MEISNSLWSGSAFSGRIELYSITCNFISHQAMLHCIELCIVENSLNNHIFASSLKQPKSLQLKWKDYKTYVNMESTSPFFPLYFQVAPQSQFSWEKDFLFEKFCQSGGGLLASGSYSPAYWPHRSQIWKALYMEPSHIHWLTSHSSLDFSKGVTVGNLGWLVHLIASQFWFLTFQNIKSGNWVQKVS